MIGLGPWRQARLCLIAVIPFAVPLSAHAVQQHRLQCPPEAPAEWGLPKPAPLVKAVVLSQSVDQIIDDNAPPLLVPDRDMFVGAYGTTPWIMGDEPGWSHFVDCQYRGSQRILRLKADGLKQCEQTAQPYSAIGGVADNAVQTMVCD
jgi:hypothetical protein